MDTKKTQSESQAVKEAKGGAGARGAAAASANEGKAEGGSQQNPPHIPSFNDDDTTGIKHFDDDEG